MLAGRGLHQRQSLHQCVGGGDSRHLTASAPIIASVWVVVTAGTQVHQQVDACRKARTDEQAHACGGAGVLARSCMRRQALIHHRWRWHLHLKRCVQAFVNSSITGGAVTCT